MTRRSIRENIFLIVFKAEFNNQEEMEEQIRYSISKIEEPEEDPEDVAITETGKVKEGDLAYIADKSHKILSMLPALDEKISEISDGWQIGRLGKPELAILRLALYEMLYDEEVPFRVAINEAVELAKKYGATVEAELGLVGGSEDGSEDHGIRCTNPDDAKIFVERTGIDALAVAIGNAHGNYPVAPKLAFDVLEQIHDKTGIPLVLHGGSGITDADFRKAIELGIVKVNIATASFNRLTKHAEEYLKSEGAHNYFDLNLAMVQGTYENVRHHIEVFNCEMPLDEVDA